jgi:hypothetical protein
MTAKQIIKLLQQHKEAYQHLMYEYKIKMEEADNYNKKIHFANLLDNTQIKLNLTTNLLTRINNYNENKT